MLLTVDDAVQLTKGALSVRAKSGDNIGQAQADDYRFGKLGFALLSAGTLLVGAILFAPFIIDTSYSAVLEILREELNPWP